MVNNWLSKYYQIKTYNDEYLKRKYTNYLISNNLNYRNSDFENLKDGIKKKILKKVVKDIKTEIGTTDNKLFDKISKINDDDIKDPFQFYNRMENQYPKQVHKFKNRILSLSEMKKSKLETTPTNDLTNDSTNLIEQDNKYSAPFENENKEKSSSICNYKIDGKRSRRKRSQRKRSRSKRRSVRKRSNKKRSSKTKKNAI